MRFKTQLLRIKAPLSKEYFINGDISKWKRNKCTDKKRRGNIGGQWILGLVHLLASDVYVNLSKFAEPLEKVSVYSA
jgi:hypothetical protein